VIGKGHPLPASDEARYNEIPEGVAAEKGRGDDARPAVQPGRDAANPDGEPYRYDDNGRAETVQRRSAFPHHSNARPGADRNS
jgi:hypothetical protein